jgi:hypothetical protein
LVIVGISPGPKQIAMAYEAVQASLVAGFSDELVLKHAKQHGSFGGPTMRPNLIKMLEFFGIHQRLNISAASELWASASFLLHATSVVPHAAIRNGKPFAGSFQEVLRSEPFRISFERDFATTLPLLPRDARYIALGPTPLAALDWCAEQDLIRKDQVLGAFAHPSSSGGSAVPVYLGKRIEELKPRDPVAKRGWLIRDAARMSRAVEAWDGPINCVAA